MRHLGFLTSFACLLAAALGFAGCPPAPQPKTANVTVLFTAAETAKAQVVQSKQVSQLLVSVDDILVTGAGDPAPAPISVLSAPQVVDLKVLFGISTLLDRAQLPVGTYTSMQLVLSSATLYLASAPTTPITDVTFPDGGSFTVPVSITVAEGQPNTLLVDLGGISLVQLNDGSYELTPDFHVRVPQPTETIPARAVGDIVSINLTTNTYAIEGQDANVTVDFSSAVIYLPSDAVSPTGIPTDLVVGDKALAFGTLGSDGVVHASVVLLIDAEDHHGGDGEDGQGGTDGHGGHHGDEGEGEGEGGEGEGEEGEGEGEDGDEGEGEDGGEGEGHGGHGGHGGDGIDG